MADGGPGRREGGPASASAGEPGRRPDARRSALRRAGLFGLALAAILLVTWAFGGGRTVVPAWSAHAALDAGDLDRALGGAWGPERPPVELESVAGFARAIVPVPDDRHLAAWRDAATGATVLQVTLVYPDAVEANELVDGPAAGLLRQHFGLADVPIAVEGADFARRHDGPDGFSAISLRLGRAVIFVGGTGLDTAGDGLPELAWTHDGEHGARLAALAGAAAGKARDSLARAAETATAAAGAGAVP